MRASSSLLAHMRSASGPECKLRVAHTQPISAGGGSNKAQKAVVNKKAKGKKNDDSDDEVTLPPQLASVALSSGLGEAPRASLQDTIAQKQKMKEDKAKVEAMKAKIKGK